jgi:Uma2 family endonuclease
VSPTITKLVTADELIAMPDDGYRYELVKGELIRMSPTGQKHGSITIALTVPLARYVQDQRLGKVYAAETGFKLESNPDTVLAPDIAFVAKEKLDLTSEAEGYWFGAPDLAVEVTSPSDRVSQVEKKVMQWLEFGARLVWVVSPKLQTVTVYRSLADITVLTEKDMLDGGDVLPGFRIPVAEIFK